MWRTYKEKLVNERQTEEISSTRLVTLRTYI